MTTFGDDTEGRPQMSTDRTPIVDHDAGFARAGQIRRLVLSYETADRHIGVGETRL